MERLASLLLILSLCSRSLLARNYGDQAFIALRQTRASAIASSAALRLASPPPSKDTPGSLSEPPTQPQLDVVYRTGVVPKHDFLVIQQQSSSLLLPGSRSGPRLGDETSSIAVGREGMVLDRFGRPSTAASLLLVQTLNDHVTKMLKKHTGLEYRLSDDVPVELRVYQKRGACMAWHQDDVLYDPPQLEVVFTVENTSDCVTRWKKETEEASIETDPNSALVLMAGGPWHCVSSLKYGRRVIVKLAYVLPGSRRIEASSSPSSRRGSTKRRGTQSTKRGTAAYG